MFDGFEAERTGYLLLGTAVEKAVKSLGLRAGVITLDDAKSRIDHKALKVYIELMKRYHVQLTSFWDMISGSVRLSKLSSILEHTISDVGKARDRIQRDFLNNNIGTCLSFSESHLRDILGKIEQYRIILEKDLNVTDSKIADFNELEIVAVRRAVLGFVDQFSEILPTNADEMKNEINKSIDKQSIKNSWVKIVKPMLWLSFCSMSLFFLCAILAPHSSRSRYLDRYDPLEIYGSENALVRMLRPIAELTEYALRKLGEIYATWSRKRVTITLEV